MRYSIPTFFQHPQSVTRYPKIAPPVTASLRRNPNPYHWPPWLHQPWADTRTWFAKLWKQLLSEVAQVNAWTLWQLIVTGELLKENPHTSQPTCFLSLGYEIPGPNSLELGQNLSANLDQHCCEVAQRAFCQGFLVRLRRCKQPPSKHMPVAYNASPYRSLGVCIICHEYT